MYKLDELWKDNAEREKPVVKATLKEMPRTRKFTLTEGRWVVLGAGGGVGGVTAGGARLLLG